MSKLPATLRARLDEREDGFTLIELLVVVVIIGILIAIAIPLYLNYQKGAHDKSAQSDLRAGVSTLEQCYTENSSGYPATTATNVAGTRATWTCGGITESMNLSAGTSATYTPAGCSAGLCTSFVLKTTNAGGNGRTYTYDSTLGGTIK